MEFRRATMDDIENLIQIRIDFLFVGHQDMTAEQIAVVKKQLPGYYEEHLGKDIEVFIATDQGKIISNAQLLFIEKPSNPRFIHGKTGEVLNVFTYKEYRRQGIAKRVMEMLLAYAKEQKFDLIELDAMEDGYPLYKKIGFQDVVTSDIRMSYII